MIVPGSGFLVGVLEPQTEIATCGVGSMRLHFPFDTDAADSLGAVSIATDVSISSDAYKGSGAASFNGTTSSIYIDSADVVSISKSDYWEVGFVFKRPSAGKLFLLHYNGLLTYVGVQTSSSNFTILSSANRPIADTTLFEVAHEANRWHVVKIKNDPQVNKLYVEFDHVSMEAASWGTLDLNIGTIGITSSGGPYRFSGLIDEFYVCSNVQEPQPEIVTKGSLFGWGYNQDGELGLGSTANNQYTMQRIGTESHWKYPVNGGWHSGAVQDGDLLWTWGPNWYGQLGFGDSADRTIPTKLGVDKWVAVSSNETHTVGIKNDGSLWAWGSNTSGQLGLGDTVSRSIPTRVGTDVNWKMIAAGKSHTVGIKNDGSLWAWGSNTSGQLGLGGFTQQLSPTQIGNETWKSIYSGLDYCFAIKTDNTLWSWGRGFDGQLGLGSNHNIVSPNQVDTATDWLTVSCRWKHTLALKNDGSLWVCGDGSGGRLGLGDLISKTTFTKVGTDLWKAVVAGYTHSVGIKQDGTLWGWGSNHEGQLGQGYDGYYDVDRLVPVRIGTCNGWLAISSGYFNTFAVRPEDSTSSTCTPEENWIESIGLTYWLSGDFSWNSTERVFFKNTPSVGDSIQLSPAGELAFSTATAIKITYVFASGTSSPVFSSVAFPQRSPGVSQDWMGISSITASGENYVSLNAFDTGLGGPAKITSIKFRV